jgi:hypothetical protein
MADVATKPKSEKLYIINIGLGNDNEPVKQFVGANGRDFLIERGKDVKVPKAVLDILDNAVMGVAEVDPTDSNKTIVVERKRFPYTIVGVVE